MSATALRLKTFGLMVSVGVVSFAVLTTRANATLRASGTAAAQVPPVAVQPASSAAARKTPAQRRAELRARRRARRLAAQQSTAQTSLPEPSTAAQRLGDQKILDQQKAESAETARENDAATAKVVREQQRAQSEPRIQDAPGPGSQPLPGDPAVAPATSNDPQGIQDAPGPAQTLPKAPPPVHAPAAPQS